MFSYQLNPQEVNSEFALLNKVGTVKAFAGSTAPDGWLFCDGSAISRTTYAALFAVIGTTYGGGDGSTTFNLPNLLILGMLAPVKGTGKSIGLMDGVNAQGIYATNIGGTWHLANATSSANKTLPYNETTPTGGVPDGAVLGLSTNQNITGIITNLSAATQTARAIIKY